MPRGLVDEAARDFMVTVGLLGLPTLPHQSREPAARALADLFDVNPVVARIRLNDIYPLDSHQMSL